MVVKTEAKLDEKYTFQRKAGRSIIERRPVFSPDGESVAIIVENIVRVFNIQTGECVRSLETESEVKELIAIQFPENENYNLCGCSDAGCLTTWTWEQGAVLREINLEIPANMRILTFDLVDSNECFITAAASNQRLIHIGTYSTKNGQLLYHYKDTRPWYYDMVCVSLGWCNGDKFAAITNGTKTLFIQNLHQPHLRSEILNHNRFRIMSVAAHHSVNSVAITDAFGRVTIIRGNLYDYRNVAKEVMHWHFLPPFAVCFSLQGNYLYTGGMERVLVKWTTSTLAYKANEKSFLPRLPGMIRYITTDNKHIAITLTNNSVVLANAQMRVVSTILECGGLSPVVRSLGSSLLYHQQLDALLMAGRTGHLQLYSTTTDKVLYNIDITGINNLPSERWNLLPLETEVSCAAVSANGSWLVTSEYRNDGNMYPEEKLKFWSIQSKTATPFRLNTCVNLSHGGCNVVSLDINNKGEFCVSAGTDQKFRIWKRDNASNTHRKKVSWVCLTACYYSSGIAQFLSTGVLNNFKHGNAYQPGEIENMPYLTEVKKNDVVKKIFNIHKEHSLVDTSMVSKKKDEFAMGGVGVSQDGSLIAAWFGCKLTLWDTHQCHLRTTMSHPALRPKGEQVMFGNNDAAHYLVCTTQSCVAVWSLLSLTVKWLVQIHPTCLAADRFSNRMAVITSNNDVFVFTPHSSTPVLIKKRLLDPKTGVFKQCTFGKTSGDNIRLYMMRNDSEVYSIEPERKVSGSLEAPLRVMPATAFGAMLAEARVSAVQPASDNAAPDTHAFSGSAITQFASAAPHMVPAVSLLCTSFLQQILGQDQSDQKEELEDSTVMEVDQLSSEDEDGGTKLNGPYAPRITELWAPNYEAVKEKKLNKIMKEPFLDLHSTSAMFGV